MSGRRGRTPRRIGGWLVGLAAALAMGGVGLLAMAVLQRPPADPADDVVQSFLAYQTQRQPDAAQALMTPGMAAHPVGQEWLKHLAKLQSTGAFEAPAGDAQAKDRAEVVAWVTFLDEQGQPYDEKLRFALQPVHRAWRIDQIEMVERRRRAMPRPVPTAARPPDVLPGATPTPTEQSQPEPHSVADATLVGQCMMVGIPGDWSPSNPSPLDVVPAGSVILYKRNIRTSQGAAGVRNLCSRIRNYVVEKHHVPEPIIAIDHEGGRVNRLVGIGDVVQWPFNGDLVAGLALQDARAKAYEVGVSMGRSLRSLTIDLDLAPVVDTATNPNNPDIGQRSYSRDPDKVAACATQFIAGLRNTGVLSCAKHWPGYGPIGENPHDSLAHTGVSRADWEATHLPPFRQAIAAGAATVMTGHVIYDQFGSGKPGSIDPVMYQLLRQETGFQGTVMTDDLEMGGVVKLFPNDFGDCAVAAIDAGADMILVCHTPSRAVRAYRALQAEQKAGRLDPAHRVARIAALRQAVAR